jgi:hypothetical protein
VSSWTKLEVSGDDCLTTDDVEAIENHVDGFVASWSRRSTPASGQPGACDRLAATMLRTRQQSSDKSAAVRFQHWLTMSKSDANAAARSDRAMPGDERLER